MISVEVVLRTSDPNFVHLGPLLLKFLKNQVRFMETGDPYIQINLRHAASNAAMPRSVCISIFTAKKEWVGDHATRPQELASSLASHFRDLRGEFAITVTHTNCLLA